MKRFRTTATVLGLAAYVAAFYAMPLAGVPSVGQPLRRAALLVQLLLRPDAWLFPVWFGTPAEFSLADRLPALLVAGGILAWAILVGWLLMVLCRADRGLCRGEVAIFSTAVGLNAIGTWVLLLGLLGVTGRLWTFAAPAMITVLAAAYVYRQRRAVVTASSRGNRSRSVGDWSIFRRESGLCQQTPAENMDQSPSAAPGGQSHFHGENVDSHGVVHRAAKIGTVPCLSSHWLWLGVPFVVAIVLAGALPPLDFDVREYHLQAPKEFFLQGRIAFLPHNVYANMALGTEMLSLLAMEIAGDWWLGALAGKVVIAACTPLCAAALFLAGRRFFTPAAGVVAALVYISVPWIVSLASGGFVEGASACYLFLALYALLLRGDRGAAVQLPNQSAVRCTHPTAMLALAGYLAGAAVATKYPAALFVFLPLAIWCLIEPVGDWSIFRRKSGFCQRASAENMDLSPSAAPGGQSHFHGEDVDSHGVVHRAAKIGTVPCQWLSAAVRRTAVFTLAAILGCGLWFGKNWVQSGNPTYPLLFEVFDGKTWNAEKQRQWNNIHRPHDFSAATLGKDLGRVALTSDWLSPLIVPLAVLAFVGPSRRRKLCWGLLAYAGFVIAVWWLLTHRIDRFWLPMLPVLALLAGAGACWSSATWWRRVLPTLLVAGLAANFLFAAVDRGNAWFVSLSRLRHAPGWITPWHEYFNTHMTNGRLLTVGDAEVFDLRPPVLYNTCFDDCIFEQLVSGKTAAEVLSELRARRITGVYVNWDEIDRYRSPGNYGFTDFVQPEVFDRLAAQGVLEPLPPIQGDRGRGYQVKTER